MKSGWATAVLLAGPPGAPRVADRRRIELSDPSLPETAQPYHAAFGTERTDAAAIEELVRVVTTCADRSIADLLSDYHALGFHPERVGVVVGSTVDPASIRNQHMRAHAQEGRLFRTVVTDAASSRGLCCTVLLERGLYDVAARALGRPVAHVRGAVEGLGRALGPPWRADQKTAATAAWLALAPAGAGQGSA